MIGVACAPHQQNAVREFFQLFKTPWEMARPGGVYDVLLVAGGADVKEIGAEADVVTIHFAARRTVGIGVIGTAPTAPEPVFIDGFELPLYGGCVTVDGSGRVRGHRTETGAVLVRETFGEESAAVLCGYDLFDEVAVLLAEGQPAAYALTPTLDLHIEILRGWLVAAGVALVEIPPTPPGCDLLATLTHDIDFLDLRRHRRDRTLAGFLYRALVGSLIDLVRGRGSLRRLTRNWAAVASLPLLHLGRRPDPWRPFAQYVSADAPWRSTFFVIPFAGRPGRAPDGTVASGRSAPYGAAEISDELRRLCAAGHEVAVHGIDAWRDAACGREELAEIEAGAGTAPRGVRMHWLYLDGGSFAELAAAGFGYDATVGYNDAVGFRAGTAQVYAPADAGGLLELPLHVQDTSLLYPSRMGLSEEDAISRILAVIDAVRRHGGVATISWHDRSLAAERLWDGVYTQALDALRARRVAVRPAGEVVDWFRLRRGLDLEGARLTAADVTDLGEPSPSRPAGPWALGETADLDALRVRVHRPAGSEAGGAECWDLPVSPARLARALSNAPAGRR